MKLRPLLIMTIMGLVALGACKKAPEPEKDSKTPRIEEPASTTKSAEADNRRDYYDEQGNLLASEQVFAGLRLPKGLMFFRNAGLTRVYRSRVPIPKLLSYFGPLLITTDVDTSDRATIYHNATVQGAPADSKVAVTVSVLDIGDRLARISIEPHGPISDQPALSPEELREHIRQEQSRLY